MSTKKSFYCSPFCGLISLLSLLLFHTKTQTLLDACQAAVKRQRAITPPVAGRSNNGKREEQRGARAQSKTKKEASASSSSLTARSTVLSAPSSSLSSQALTTTTTTSSNATPRGVLASSLPSSLSGFFSNLWSGNRSQAWTPSSSSSSSRSTSPSSFSSSLSASSSPRTRRQQLLTSSPHQLLLSFLGFVALALGFHLRRSLGMGSRALAQRAARLLQRIITVILLGGKDGVGRRDA